MSAASVPRAASEAVPQSTQATAARIGCSGVPLRYVEPHMSWATPSKPCLWLQGPPAPKAVTVVRMMSGFTRPEAVEVERERAEHLGRQVGHHDVGGRHELPHDLAPLLAGRVERHGALVPVHREIERAHAVGGDRRHPAVLAPAAPLDADHVGAEVAQERRAVRPGDVASEVEHPDSARTSLICPSRSLMPHLLCPMRPEFYHGAA